MSDIGLPMSSATGPQPAGASQRPTRKKSCLRGCGCGFLIVLLLVGAGIAGLGATGNLDRARNFVTSQWDKFFAADYEGEGEGNTIIVINDGATVSQIADSLAVADVVASPQAFVNAVPKNGGANALQPGTYTMPLRMSGVAAYQRLTSADAKLINRIVVPEGTRMVEVVRIASEATGIPATDFEAVLRNPVSLGLPPYAKNNAEGFLYPATYEVAPDATAESVLKEMVATFNKNAAEIQLEQRAAAQGRNPYDIVIIASLLDAEGTPKEYGRISRVVANRLAAGMPLQFDSTVNYSSNASNIQLTQEQLASDSPYNTYKIKGLPPTPIGQADRNAMEAALDPEPGDWLFFVTVNPSTKETKFTASYQEFLGFVEELNAYLRANPQTTGSR